MKVTLILMTLLLFTACVQEEEFKEKEFKNGKQVGQNTKGVNENSGMAWSNEYEQLYTINDSGNGAYLYVSEMKGKLLKKVKVRKADNTDWEGLSLGEYKGKSCLFIGDIGDNSESRKYHYVYIVEERKTYPSKVNYLEKVKYSYADGTTPNAESLAVHPLTGDIYIATKNYGGHPTRVYRINAEDIGSNNVKAYKVGEIDFKELNEDVTDKMTYTAGMSFSPSGSKFILITAQSEQVWEFTFDLGDMEKFEHEDLVNNFNLFKVDYLGQEESIDYLNEDEFIYTSEGDKAPIVKVTTN